VEHQVPQRPVRPGTSRARRVSWGDRPSSTLSAPSWRLRRHTLSSPASERWCDRSWRS